MNKYGIHYYGALGFGDDGAGARDDNGHPYKSDFLPSGKTIRPDHYRMPMPESSPEGIVEALEKALEEGVGNRVDIEYKLGCAYAAKGDRDRAVLHLEQAARQGHGDAEDRLAGLGVTIVHDKARSKAEPEREKATCAASGLPALPRLKYFRVCEFVTETGKREYILLISADDRKGLRPASAVLAECGRHRQTDVYATKQEAYDAGMKIKKSWGV